MKTFPIFTAVLALAALMTHAAEPIDPEMVDYPYPYAVQFLPLTVQQQTVQMAYMDVAGPTADARAVLLLHGKNFPASYWGPVMEDLSKAGFRVIAPDQIGFGKSSKPETLQYSFQLLAENSRKLLKHLKVDKVTVVGHSMGGMLATRFALMYPERTEGLVLENPIGLEDWKTVVPYQGVDAWYQSELKKSEAGIRAYQRESYYHGEWKEAYEPWVEVLYRWTLHPEYPRVAWNAALTYDMIFTQPVVYEFPNVQADTLLIIGQLDKTALGKDRAPEAVRGSLGNYVELGQRAGAAIPSAKLVALEGVGHMPHVEAYPRFWEALIAFLNREQ